MTRGTRSKDRRPLISMLAFRSALAFSLFCAGGSSQPSRLNGSPRALRQRRHRRVEPWFRNTTSNPPVPLKELLA